MDGLGRDRAQHEVLGDRHRWLVAREQALDPPAGEGGDGGEIDRHLSLGFGWTWHNR